MARRLSYAQNGEDIRVWRAFRDQALPLTYVDVGANEPFHLSITASLHDMGWRGLLIEADPDLAHELRVHRPDDRVLQVAAAAEPGELTFYRVPGTGLGTLDADEAEQARARGFAVQQVVVPTRPLDALLSEAGIDTVHFMSIDVEGAEPHVLTGLGLAAVRPWVLCIEAVLPGTSTPSHDEWEPRLLEHGYLLAAFDGVNRWYVAQEHADLIEAIATPFNAIDAGAEGWVLAEVAADRERIDRGLVKRAWQRELILNDIRHEVPKAEYERQIDELRTALISVEGSRTFQWSRRLTKIGKAIIHRGRLLMARLPGPVQRGIVRRRHLKHVTVNLGHLTDPAYLGNPPADVVDWITPDGLPPAPIAGFGLAPLSTADRAAIDSFLAGGPYDTDALLERRLDNHGDELGRAHAAFDLRLKLADGPPVSANGNRVLIDARCLQTPHFGSRGIGRFAKAALLGARDALGDDRITLLVDRGLEALPADLAGECRQITRLTDTAVAEYSVLVQPSPMTASALPLVPILHSDAHKIAIVFDFIPMHYPTVYLRHVAARAEYAAALDALRCYDDFVCISHLAKTELGKVLGKPVTGPDAIATTVAWPRDVLPKGDASTRVGAGDPNGPIIVMTGDEPRKNTFGALAAIGAATAGDTSRDVVVIGMGGQDVRVHHWSIAAAMRPGEARTAGHLSDEEMTALLASASVVVVASFDEGLSLPVIEALRAGAPVVAADIPAHRELIGRGSFLADPRSPKALAKAIRRQRGKASTAARQLRRLSQHRHAPLEVVIGRKAAQAARPTPVALAPAAIDVSGRPLRVGFATPWTPQRSGVADFSTTTTIELARLCDVTVYSTADTDVAGSIPPGVRLAQRPIADVLRFGAGPGGSDDDVFVSVVGNSHFHLPFIEVTERIDSVVVSHDTRLVEMFLSLRGRGGVEHLMLRGTGRRELSPSLDEQIDDMRLLENAGFWEVARRARGLILHTPNSAQRIADETGVTPILLPFANQRAPRGAVGPAERAAARARLGFDEGTVHLASFGYVDLRTKMSDVVLEAAAWLTQWGHRVSLHFAGHASAADERTLRERALQAGIAEVQVTGFLSEEQFCDVLLAVDLGVQLRVSPLLGVSGPLSDLAAWGTPAVASNGLCIDVDTPEYIDRLPDEVSPVMVAEAIEHRLADPWAWDDIEQARRAYLAAKSPTRYAELMLEVLTGFR